MVQAYQALLNTITSGVGYRDLQLSTCKAALLVCGRQSVVKAQMALCTTGQYKTGEVVG